MAGKGCRNPVLLAAASSIRALSPLSPQPELVSVSIAANGSGNDGWVGLKLWSVRDSRFNQKYDLHSASSQ